MKTQLERAASALQLPTIQPRDKGHCHSLSVSADPIEFQNLPTATLDTEKNTPPTTSPKHAHDEYTCPFSHIHALVTSTAELSPVVKAAVLVIAVGLVYTEFCFI